MGLTWVHNPDALCHFARVTFCPWCGKEGQNEGTIVYHLRTTHYELGLVCLEAIQCHGLGCKKPKGSNAKEEGGGLNMALDSD